MKSKKVIAALCALAVVVSSSGGLPFSGLRLFDTAITASADVSISGTNIYVVDSASGTVSSDMTCTKFNVFDSSTLTINQGVTVTLNNPGRNFVFHDNSKIELHGTLAGSAGSDGRWTRSYINVYLSDGAKYTVTGLTCRSGDNYLVYYGYDAATDGNGTVSVKNGTTDVTSTSKGYKTTSYTFTATPSDGYKFVNWTKGAGGEVLGTDASINVTCEQNGQYQVYANFEAAATDPTYTITIPAEVDLKSTDPVEITAEGVTLNEGQKIVVTLDSATYTTSGSEFSAKDKSGESVVKYKINDGAIGLDDANKTVAEFTEGGSKELSFAVTDETGIKFAGAHSEELTFGVKLETAKTAAEKPDIAQADCTFSPSNGKSTLSNANITTAMEYSADNGTTWTDVTSDGSIASLAAGTVQIRVKETADKLASEAVSITVPEVLHINELVGPYTGDKLTCEYYAGETWQALVNRYNLIKQYSGRAAFGSDGFIYDESGGMIPVTDLIDNTKTYEVQ